MSYPTNKEMRDIIDKSYADHKRWFISNPRQSGKSWAREAWDLVKGDGLHEYAPIPFVAWDLAKLGSDQTVVHPAPAWRDTVYLEFGADGKTRYIQPKGSARDIAPCPIAEAAFPRQSEPDRIWDLIVLAAESSRYGK